MACGVNVHMGTLETNNSNSMMPELNLVHYLQLSLSLMMHALFLTIYLLFMVVANSVILHDAMLQINATHNHIKLLVTPNFFLVKYKILAIIFDLHEGFVTLYLLCIGIDT